MPGVQQQTRRHLLIGGIAIQGIARNRVADRLQMHTNLMRTACFRGYLQHRMRAMRTRRA